MKKTDSFYHFDSDVRCLKYEHGLEEGFDYFNKSNIKSNRNLVTTIERSKLHIPYTSKPIDLFLTTKKYSLLKRKPFFRVKNEKIYVTLNDIIVFDTSGNIIEIINESKFKEKYDRK